LNGASSQKPEGDEESKDDARIGTLTCLIL